MKFIAGLLSATSLPPGAGPNEAPVPPTFRLIDATSNLGRGAVDDCALEGALQAPMKMGAARAAMPVTTRSSFLPWLNLRENGSVRMASIRFERLEPVTPAAHVRGDSKHASHTLIMLSA